MSKTWNQIFSFLSFLTHYPSGHSVSDGVGGAYVSNSADYLKLTWQLEWTADRPKQKGDSFFHM